MEAKEDYICLDCALEWDDNINHVIQNNNQVYIVTNRQVFRIVNDHLEEVNLKFTYSPDEN